MNLYIQIQDEQPINHPCTEENLLQAFGSIDTTWELFVRIDCPTPNIYQIVNEQSFYGKVNGVWTDVWSIRDMTNEEKLAKQQLVKDQWNSFPRPNQTSWVFNEETCAYEAPVSMPRDDQQYYWNEEANSWFILPSMPQDDQKYRFNVFVHEWQVEPDYPQDDKQYRFNQQTWSWIEIINV